MSGPEHYAAAEKLVDQADGSDVEFARYLTAKAQVHATLALVAATAASRTTWTDQHSSTTATYLDDGDGPTWKSVTA